MSKVSVDRELLERIERCYMDGMSIYGECEEIRAILAQTAEAEGGIDLKPILEDVEREYEMGGLSDGLYADYASDVAKRYASAALSAVTAERDRLQEALNFACKALCQVTSSDGSGHADIALSVLRLAGVGADEREALVEGWKANVKWRADAAMAAKEA